MTGLGDRLAHARRAAGLTQRHAAELVGVAPTTWAAWEQGRAVVGADRLARIAEVLDLNAEGVGRLVLGAGA